MNERGMTGAQIKSYLEKFCPSLSLAGIYSIDKLKNVKLKEDQCIVVNTGENRVKVIFVNI